MTRAFVLCAAFLAAALSLLHAGVTAVKWGTVEAISADQRTITVKFAHADKSTELRTSPQLRIKLDGKSVDLEALKPGMSATVQIGSDGEAELILARAGSDTPLAPATAKRPKPKAPSSRKLSKSSSKSTSKRQSAKGLRDFGGSSVAKPFANLKEPDSASAKGDPWPSFLGPNRDNISRESGLLQSWPPEGPQLLWKTPGLGLGYSTVSVVDGVAYSMGTPGNQESVLAIDLESGQPLWTVPTGGGVFRESQGGGPRSTPTIDRGSAYALGAGGDLVAIDIKSRSVRWHKNLIQEFGAPSLMYGYSESVLIDGPRLICTPGAPGATLVALDKDTGDVIWKSVVPTNPPAAYASPIVAEVGGFRQYVAFVSRGVVGVNARDGQFLWANEAAVNSFAICTTPVFTKDGEIFVSSGYGAGAALIRLVRGDQGFVGKLVYHSHELKNHHGGLVALRGYVYAADDSILTCFSLEQGRAVWRDRSVGKCSLTYADGNLYVRSESGPVALVEATPEGYRERGRFMPPTSGAPSWPYPVVAAGRLFLRDQNTLLCYSLREQKP